MRALFSVIVSISVAAASPAVALLGTGNEINQAGIHPQWAEFSQVKVHRKWKNGGCKYDYKADKKGVKEKIKCK